MKTLSTKLRKLLLTFLQVNHRQVSHSASLAHEKILSQISGGRKAGLEAAGDFLPVVFRDLLRGILSFVDSYRVKKGGEEFDALGRVGSEKIT